MNMEETKQVRSLCLKYICKELYVELRTLMMNYDIDNNAKGFELKRLLKEYNVPFTPLGSGTNRFGILIDGYAFKFALDDDGRIDNEREILYSKLLQPYVVKCYEIHEHGLIIVTEYVEIFTLDSFYRYQDEMRNILAEITKTYLVGDVGVTSKNYINWAIRHRNGKEEICIMDFAYIYSVKHNTFKCTCADESLLRYDKDYVHFICPSCGRKYTFGDLRRKITRKAQKEEIGDLRELGYVIHNETEIVKVNPKFTEVTTKKKEKQLTESQKVIDEYYRKRAEAKRLMEMYD
jgi:predicted RNA-binding Zn-ribbon protein involved in translation (DUF1610 family)